MHSKQLLKRKAVSQSCSMELQAPKTEVYARVIAESVQNNQGVLILTPEIALTPQLSAYLKDIFNDQVETYHSGVTPKRRYEIWERKLDQERLKFMLEQDQRYCYLSRILD